MDELVTWLREQLDEDERMTASEPDDWRTRGTYTDHFTADRALADIAAKRKIIDMHVGEHECPSQDDNCGWWVTPCPTLRLLASPHADREGYREEWRP